MWAFFRYEVLREWCVVSFMLMQGVGRSQHKSVGKKHAVGVSGDQV